MKVGLAQIDPVVGDLQGNFEKILKFASIAKEKGADLIIFPELALFGYPPLDLLERTNFIEQNLEYLNKLKSCLVLDTIIGALTVNPGSGKPLYNSAVYISEGEVKEIIPKSFLNNWGVFDEARWFEPASTFNPIKIKDYSVGIFVGESLLMGEMSLENQRLYEDKVDIIINITASPFTIGKDRLRYKGGVEVAKKVGAPLMVVNQVGGDDEFIFDGGSFVVTPIGEVVASAKSFCEDLIIYDLKLNKGDINENGTEHDELDMVIKALQLGIKDFLYKCGFDKAVLGLSGGIDSAVVAVLASNALGANNVWGVAMPSRYTSQSSLIDAEMLAKNLGIRFDIISIEELFSSSLLTLSPIFENLPFSVAEENIQARLRGLIIMAISNKFGYFPLATGNKSEFAVGYATLYGDMCGGLAPIGDLTKTLVYKLAHRINQFNKIIPESIINKAPSAELRPNQKDEDNIPPYSILDQIIHYYIECNREVEEIVKLGFEREIVEQAIHLFYKSEYKRRQAPPILRITNKPFGGGIRYPIAKKVNFEKI